MATRTLHPRLSSRNIGGNLDLNALKRLTGHCDDRPDTPAHAHAPHCEEYPNNSDELSPARVPSPERQS